MMASNILRTLFTVLFFTVQLQAAVVPVGAPPASIQAAVNLANPGDTVQLSNGTYVQSVSINKNITLNGNGQGISIIQCPVGAIPNAYIFTPTGELFRPIVMVQGATATNVIIQNLTVDGAGRGNNKFRFVGIGYHNAGGTVQDVTVMNVKNTPTDISQAGTAIAGAIDDNNPYTLLVQNCDINTFQKNGMDMRGTTLNAQILSNNITGIAPLSPATPNGMVIRNGAFADIQMNTLSNLRTANPLTSSVGIFTISSALNQNIQNNTISNSEIGIDGIGAGDGLNIVQNTLQNNDDGILIQNPLGTTILTANSISNSVEVGMALSDLVDNRPFNLSLNQITGGADGLVVIGSGLSGPVVTMNSDSFVGTTGFYIQEINAPHDIWPSTATVSFDGLVSGQMTFAQFKAVQAKIVDRYSPVFNPLLGIVLEFIPPTPPTPNSFTGKFRKNEFLTQSTNFRMKWTAAEVDFPVSYRIYKKNKIVAVIPASDPFVFETFVKSLQAAQSYSIDAVNANGVASPRIPITIVQ